jgi:hypothetical protein
MGIFKRRARSLPEAARSEPAVHEADPAPETDETTVADRAGGFRQETAEEHQEFDDEVEAGRGPRRGLNPHWGLSRGGAEVSRREARSAADPESDTAETLFIQAEREAEQRGRYGPDD